MGDFDQILNSWLMQFDKGQVPVDSNMRIFAYKDLFERFQSAEFPKDYFTSSIKGRIVTKSINPNHTNKKKRRTWAEYATKHLDMAFHTIYTEAVKQESNPLESAPSLEAVTETDIDAIVDSHEPTIPKPKAEPKIEIFADTVQVNSDLPSLKVDFDPELAKLLGIELK